jgi:hypothetical protein
MKKTLIVAALVTAATALPAMPTFAADSSAPDVESKCYVLPLLPDCAEQWNDAWAEEGFHLTVPYKWWTCVKAEEGSGHLLDCEKDA